MRPQACGYHYKGPEPRKVLLAIQAHSEVARILSPSLWYKYKNN